MLTKKYSSLISKRLLKVFVVLGLFFCLNTMSHAQPDDAGPPTGDPVPLSGIEILLASGALLGAKRFFDFKKKQ
jgi:hypothetical protein